LDLKVVKRMRIDRTHEESNHSAYSVCYVILI